MEFARRQVIRKDKRRLHQKKNAALMQKVGGYNSYGWRTYADKIRQKINKRLAAVMSRKQERLVKTQAK